MRAIEQAQTIPEEKLRANALDRACTLAEKRLIELTKTNGCEIPTTLVDNKAERPIYKQLEESEGPLNRIMINPNTGSDKPVDIASISQVIKAIAPFKALRVYIKEGDEKAKIEVDQIIEEEAKRCRY